MTVGQVHTINGYTFTETFHGPNVERACVACDQRAYATPAEPEPYCQPCLLVKHGAKHTVVRVLGEGQRTPALGPGAAGVQDRTARLAAVVPIEPHPAPEVPCVTLDPAGIARYAPSPAILLAGYANQAGWAWSVTYARGTKHTGNVVDSIAVRMWRFPDQRAVALWEDGRAAGGWSWTVGALPVDVGVDVVKRLVADRPERAPREPAAKRWCMNCATEVSVRKDGALRVHGPKDNRCTGT